MVNPSTAQARVVVDELIRGGVRDFVLCPGSRNAPLAFALRDADADGRVRLHVRIDERTAGYLAIGLAVATIRPIIGFFFATSRLTHLTPHEFFGTAFWLGFTLQLMAAEAWIHYTQELPQSARIVEHAMESLLEVPPRRR